QGWNTRSYQGRAARAAGCRIDCRLARYYRGDGGGEAGAEAGDAGDAAGRRHGRDGLLKPTWPLSAETTPARGKPRAGFFIVYLLHRLSFRAAAVADRPAMATA